MYETEGCARAAIADASKLPLLEPLAWTLQRDLHPELAELDAILSALERVAAEEPQAEPAKITGIAETEEETIESLKDLASGAPIVRAVNDHSLNSRLRADRPTSTLSRCAAECAFASGSTVS